MPIMHSGPMPSQHAPTTDPKAALRPLHWLSLGLQDFRRARSVGLTYGLMVTLLGWLMLILGNHPYFIAAAVTGFLLVGPILGAGLIESSRIMEAGGTPTFDSSLRGLDANPDALRRFALALLAIAIAWLALSTTLLIAAMGPLAPRIEQTLWDSALQFMSSQQLLAWVTIGGVLAAICYCISVIAVPLILDRHASAADAMRGSWRAVTRHPLACVAWALLIVVLVAIGFATLLLGLIVIYPILGHASWHAYRDLRDQPRHGYQRRSP